MPRMPDAPWSCALLFTRHANARIRERKIRREVVRPTIIKGRTIAQSGGKLVSHRHGRRIVWVKKPCHFVVVTVM
jgi:hypothetical protein